MPKGLLQKDPIASLVVGILISGVLWWASEPIRSWLNQFDVSPIVQIGVGVLLLLLIKYFAKEFGIKK